VPDGRDGVDSNDIKLFILCGRDSEVNVVLEPLVRTFVPARSQFFEILRQFQTEGLNI